MSIWTHIADAIAGLAARGETLLALFEREVTPPERSVAFTIAVVSLGAKMAKADGLVKPVEVAAFRQVFRIAPHDEPAAARVFNLARQDTAGFDAYARGIARMFADQTQVLEDILEGLFHIAMADGRYHEGEEVFLREVGTIFGVPDRAFGCIEARHLRGQLDLRAPDPWRVLGVPRDADMVTLRARWRELVRAHHPDQMIARGLPTDAVSLANARLAAINQAWKEISESRSAHEIAN
jgi:DnaJ like chaperone protein